MHTAQGFNQVGDFYPRSPRGERRSSSISIDFDVQFLSTLPARGATARSPRRTWPTRRFLSTLPARGATCCCRLCPDWFRHFYPRSPRGERPVHSPLFGQTLCHFYPRSPRGERLVWCDSRPARIHFYPRSPRGERPGVSRSVRPTGYFYPRSPRGERRQPACNVATGDHDFYPRSPRGERRSPSNRSNCYPSHFYPRSPRGERPVNDRFHSQSSKISIHAPREGSDRGPGIWGRRCASFLSTLPARGATRRRCRLIPAITKFLSTLPARGATQHCYRVRSAGTISIHAPREGSDLAAARDNFPIIQHFYPRSPRGERHEDYCRSHPGYKFLSTLPARGATSGPKRAASTTAFLSTLPARGATLPRPVIISQLFNISIHAPREGSDTRTIAAATPATNFYPRSPRGERPMIAV